MKICFKGERERLHLWTPNYATGSLVINSFNTPSIHCVPAFNCSLTTICQFSHRFSQISLFIMKMIANVEQAKDKVRHPHSPSSLFILCTLHMAFDTMCSIEKTEDYWSLAT